MSAAEFPLDPSIFWETVADFAAYDHASSNPGGTRHSPDPSARPGYPGELIRRATGLAPGLKGALDADAAEARPAHPRRFRVEEDGTRSRRGQARKKRVGPSGAIDGGAHELALQQGSSVVAKVALPGSRDMFATDHGAGVDALHVQGWLTMHRDGHDKPYVAEATDKRDKASARALARFRADHLEPTADFATVAAALAAPPAAAAGGLP